ncbi:M23 family metallopeptidase [Aeromicrobium chenweiae]|nr:peptidoglycan DD-metalloendopeptidase family protein [Aeromicrobium chenweiae]
MIGAVALIAAVLGTYTSAGANGTDGDLTSLGYEQPESSLTTDAPAEAADDRVDVSRGVDRPKLEKQTKLQATQRAQALREVDRDITAAAQARERQKKAREHAKKVRAQQKKARAAQKAKKRSTQWVLPVAGYTLTARFGQQSSLWSSGAHTGLDFAGPSGTKIVAVAAGTVTSAGYEGSYGNRTVVTLPNGTKISYCHQSRIDANVGDKVQPGETIGFTGSTGNVTGPHLHLEVELPGTGQTDPEPVLRQHGITP